MGKVDYYNSSYRYLIFQKSSFLELLRIVAAAADIYAAAEAATEKDATSAAAADDDDEKGDPVAFAGHCTR